MGPGSYGHGQVTGIVITLVVVIAVVLLRNSRPRRLRLEAMWIRPLIFVVLIAVSAFAAPPPLTPVSIATVALALIVGAALGWQRGRFMRIDVHPETHDITSQASPIGMLFILAVVAARMGLRGMAYESRGLAGLSTAMIASGLILLVGAMMITQSVEMWLRARKMLAEAQAAKAPLASPGANPPIVS
ncbi:MAG TPA: hypothetical protein VG166_06050 [Caulobacteraceae bacterium]|jgi:hypothetical protein|nr:hypothetical protein [Caulobacteraceae bacterium]